MGRVVRVAPMVGVAIVAALMSSASPASATPDAPHPVAPVVTTVSVPLVPARGENSRRVASAPQELAFAPSDVVGLSFEGPAERGTTVMVSVRESGVWSAEFALSVDDAQRAGRVTVEPLVTHGADRARVRFVVPSGHVPSGVQLVAIDSPASAADSSSATIRPSTDAPAVVTRAQWGADESRRTAPIQLSPTLQVGVLHHTTGWTEYSQSEAYQFVRALYDWYTTPVAQGGPGFGDIAYNLLVDRYGRVFEGRAGSATSAVVADHTVGFNANTLGVAALGDFDANPLPSDDSMLMSIARVMAWKLGPYGRNPFGTERLTSNASGGSSRYSAGQSVSAPVIATHAFFSTSNCPGKNLADRMNSIRYRAASLMNSTWAKPAASLGTPRLTPAALPYQSASSAVLRLTTTRPMRWVARALSPCTGKGVMAISGTQSLPGPLNVEWNLRDQLGLPVSPGRYTLHVTGTPVDGGTAAAPVDVDLHVQASESSAPGPCESVARMASDTLDSAAIAVGRWSAPTANAAVLVARETDSDLGYLQVAAPFARARKLPMLLVGRSSVPDSVLADLAARGIHQVIVIGPRTVLTIAVERQLTAKGIAFTRIGSIDLPTTAAAVARAMRVPPARGAVFVVPASQPAQSSVAAAAAARTGRPLLILNPGSVPAATSAVVRDLGLRGGAVIAPRTTVPDSVVTDLGATRFWSPDAVTLALAIAPHASAGDRAVLTSVGSRERAAIAAAAGRTLLPVPSSGPTRPVLLWLSAHTEVTEIAVVIPASGIRDVVLEGLSRSLIDRPASSMWLRSTSGLGKRGAAVTPPIPASFTINGSGWGHGIGLSQAGAYGQAKEGRTAEQIVTYYYTGTAVQPVVDTMDLQVALQHRVQQVTINSEPMLAGGSGAIRVALASGVSVVGRPADSFTFGFNAGKVTVTRTTAGKSTVIGTAASARVTWAGTRTAGSLGSNPTVVHVVGPDDSVSDPQNRYRYGFIALRPIRASSSEPAGLMVINSVRLHDEYLYGIAEVQASWPLEALRAQILASRSYAYAQWKAGLRASCLCHSDDGGGPYYDQTFLGWVKVDEGSYSRAWRQAVRSTAVSATTGEAILYNGDVISAYYTDSTGGFTQNNEDVWGDAPVPWARSVDDHWSLDPANSPSFAHWRPRVRSQARVAAAFGLPDVVSVAVTTRLASQTARWITATSSTGVKSTISGAKFRRAMELPSQWIWSVVGKA